MTDTMEFEQFVEVTDEEREMLEEYAKHTGGPYAILLRRYAGVDRVMSYGEL